MSPISLVRDHLQSNGSTDLEMDAVEDRSIFLTVYTLCPQHCCRSFLIGGWRWMQQMTEMSSHTFSLHSAVHCCSCSLPHPSAESTGSVLAKGLAIPNMLINPKLGSDATSLGRSRPGNISKKWSPAPQNPVMPSPWPCYLHAVWSEQGHK